MKAFVLILCFNFLSQVAWSRVLLVSDIDDTLKISHTKSIFDKIQLGLSVESRFMGMSSLYSALLNANKNIKIVYLSNAPEWLMYSSHKNLLRLGNFPRGSLILRQGDTQKLHKVYRLRELIDQSSPDVVILIGDNAQYDTFIYNQIKREYDDKEIVFLQFIRQAYNLSDGEPLIGDQVGFVSPLKIILKLKQTRFLSPKTADSLAKNISQKILNADPPIFSQASFFPYWLRCPQWEAPQTSNLAPEVTKALQYIENNICG